MDLVFLYGPVAAGKLTVARALASVTGYALFHNHLVVDAVGAVLPFGSEDFVRLRERWWMDAFEAAARTGRSTVFTFAPEPTVAPDFPRRARARVEDLGGRVHFVSLAVDPVEQERRLASPSRTAYGKMRSIEQLRALRAAFDASLAAMPAPALRIDTGTRDPASAAEEIVRTLGLPLPPR